jgi:hypothetical protein
VEWRVAVAFISPNQIKHVDQGNHGHNRYISTPPSIVGYFKFKSLPNILFPNIISYTYNFPTSFSNILSISKSLCHHLRESYFLNRTTMSQPSTQTSPTKSSPQKSSPSKTTTTVPNTTENPSVHLP